MAQQLLIIGNVFPEPDSSAAGGRMLQLVELFKRHCWEITFASAATEREYATDLSGLGVVQVPIKLNDSSFDDFVRELNPQLVLFDRFMTEEQFGWRVAKNSPNAMRILDTEDLHCLRHGRHRALKENREFQTLDLYNETAKREIASLYRSDLSLIISKYEMELLKTIFDIDDSLLHHLPFMVDPISVNDTANWKTFEERQNFVTIGNFLHAPNWDAIQYLKNKIWSLIRKELPETEMHVYGAYCSEKHHQLHSETDGFLIKGRAEDANDVISKARVLLTPLRFGAGLKGKLLQAMQCGTPSITTTIGAEAMHGDLPWSGLIADTPEDFTKAAVEIYTDTKLWSEAQNSGTDIINHLFWKKPIGDEFINRVEELYPLIETHRTQNFIGSMLMHHTMKSTEYMSRWIESKKMR